MRHPLAILAVSLAVLVATCKRDGGTATPVPASVTINPAGVTLNALGASDTLTATVRDQNGTVIAGAGVTWTSDNGMVAGVSASGVVTAVGNGTTTIRAAAGAVEGTASVTVAAAGVPASVAVAAGDNQTGLVGFAVNIPPAVIVRDPAGAPVPNAQVDFAVTGGGGSVTGGTALTGADGIAAVGSWVLGGTPAPNALSATVAAGASGNPATFAATGSAPQYNIEVRFLDPQPTQQQKEAFDSAEARWERLIYGDLPDINLNEPATTCATVDIPAMNEVVDDIVIFAQLDSIDGPTPPGGSSIVGVATPCNPVRGGTLLIIRGIMKFDTADVAGILAQGLFDEVVMHEMGHVLGFTPALWNPKGLLVDPAESGGVDPHFVGAQATGAFDRSGGADYSAGAKVPIENVGGPGTIDGHWRETVFATELMTGTLDNGVLNALSVVTTASMGDLGYTVNYAGSDAYVVANPLALRMGTATGIRLREVLPVWDVIVEVDASGRVVRTRRLR